MYSALGVFMQWKVAPLVWVRSWHYWADCRIQELTLASRLLQTVVLAVLQQMLYLLS